MLKYSVPKKKTKTFINSKKAEYIYITKIILFFLDTDCQNILIYACRVQKNFNTVSKTFTLHFCIISDFISMCVISY